MSSRQATCTRTRTQDQCISEKSSQNLKVVCSYATVHYSDVLLQCEQMLLYLTCDTWTRGEVSQALAREVLTAMTGGVRLLLVHEAPSWHQSTPNACPFGDFFTCDRGATPTLLLRAGIYGPIATQLRAKPLRTASLVALVQQIGTKDAHKRTPNEMLRTRQLEVVRAMTQRISLRAASRLGDDTEENSVVAVIETGISHMLGFMELGSMKLGSMKLGGAAPAQEQTPLRERERIVHSFHGHGTVISSVNGIVKVRFDEPKRTKWYRRHAHYKLHRPASCEIEL